VPWLYFAPTTPPDFLRPRFSNLKAQLAKMRLQKSSAALRLPQTTYFFFGGVFSPSSLVLFSFFGVPPQPKTSPRYRPDGLVPILCDASRVTTDSPSPLLLGRFFFVKWTCRSATIPSLLARCPPPTSVFSPSLLPP